MCFEQKKKWRRLSIERYNNIYGRALKFLNIPRITLRVCDIRVDNIVIIIYACVASFGGGEDHVNLLFLFAIVLLGNFNVVT